MLTHSFSDERYQGTPYKSEHVDYFRDAHGRCVALVNARLEAPKLVDGAPMPTFDRIEIDGARVTGPELDRLVPKVMRVLYAVPWDQTDERTALIRAATAMPRSRPIPPHTPG